MTFQALNTAITGLRAAQQQLAVISNNVTNATTEGYNRQILPQSTQVLRETGTTVGVLTETVIRQVDMNLQRDLWTQISASSMQSVQIDYLQQIQTFNGPPDKEFSIATKLAELRDSFSALSDIPDDTNALEQTVYQAGIVADKFNDYADLLTQLRNDTQGDLQTSINTVNNLLAEIANINLQIKGAENFGNSVAGLQDQRDIAIKSLTEQIDVSFFERADGVLVVQTREGQELAGDFANSLEIEPQPLSALQYYPDTVGGLILVTTTNNRETRQDITEREIGGKIGGLLELRDDVLPSYHAQLDELAFQLAHRMDLQGLRLFTDQDGNVPLNDPPDPSVDPPVSVDYVDFARNIQVNNQIVNDNRLLQSGTYVADVNIPTGDNSVIKRVLENVFGEINFQTAIGTIDLTDTGANTELQVLLGLESRNQVVAGIDFTSFTQIDDGNPTINDPTQLIDSFAEIFTDFQIAPALPNPGFDAFQITFEDLRGPTPFGPTTITIELSEARLEAGANAGEQLVAEINEQIGLAGLAANEAAVSLNTYGQLVFESRGNVTIDGSGFVGPAGSEAMGTAALNALGIQEGVYTTEDPSFTVQVGNDPAYTITIEPQDTILDLETKLTYNATTGVGVPGLSVEVDALTGTLTLRPGIDDTNFGPAVTQEEYGGELTITGSAFLTNAAANGAPDDINIVSAIFGSFDLGPPVTESSPITDVTYVSEISNGSGLFTNFRNEFLGPNAGIETGIFSATNLLDYAQKIVDETSQDYLAAQSAFENEDTLRSILQREFTDDSGVNIDEEMSNLIIVQTAYAAAARTVTAADEMFEDLINSFR
ncbi:MAG: flagellar hook-associated protein FlgK [Pseudomonadota bacterium]